MYAHIEEFFRKTMAVFVVLATVSGLQFWYYCMSTRRTPCMLVKYWVSPVDTSCLPLGLVSPLLVHHNGLCVCMCVCVCVTPCAHHRSTVGL